MNKSQNHFFSVAVAEQLGVNCAILYSNIQFWVEKNEANNCNYEDGKFWTYCSVSGFKKLFPYFTEKQIRTALQKLADSGYIITGNYNKKGYDKTTWYSLGLICPTGQIDLPLRADAFAPEGEPIPDNKPDSKTDNNNKEKEVFESFRKNYKGTKRGLETEFKCFQKHKDWKEVLPLLDQALSAEEEQRRLATVKNEFFPNRCNLQTWLNQRRWENEFDNSPVELSDEQYVVEYHRLGYVEFKNKYGKELVRKIAFIAEQ